MVNDRPRSGNITTPNDSERVSSVAGLVKSQVDDLPPAFGGTYGQNTEAVRRQILRATHDWLARSPSPFTRTSYALDLRQFLVHVGAFADEMEHLITVRPGHIAAWRDALQEQGLTNATIRRKLTSIRSLFSYLQTYGYMGANPAHGKFVKAPSVARDGKTVGLSSQDCRRLMDAPDPETPVGKRDRAMLAILAYTGCRVGELVRLKVSSYRTSGGHHLLTVMGKGMKERNVPLHPEAFERLLEWMECAAIRDEVSRPLFRPSLTSRGRGFDGFAQRPMSRRSVEFLVARYVHGLGLDPNITVHSFRVTALTTARERGADIIDLQDYAGHADPRTTLTYIRSRDRLSKSPAYLLTY